MSFFLLLILTTTVSLSKIKSIYLHENDAKQLLKKYGEDAVIFGDKPLKDVLVTHNDGPSFIDNLLGRTNNDFYLNGFIGYFRNFPGKKSVYKPGVVPADNNSWAAGGIADFFYINS